MSILVTGRSRFLASAAAQITSADHVVTDAFGDNFVQFQESDRCGMITGRTTALILGLTEFCGSAEDADLLFKILKINTRAPVVIVAVGLGSSFWLLDTEIRKRLSGRLEQLFVATTVEQTAMQPLFPEIKVKVVGHNLPLNYFGNGSEFHLLRTVTGISDESLLIIGDKENHGLINGAVAKSSKEWGEESTQPKVITPLERGFTMEQVMDSTGEVLVVTDKTDLALRAIGNRRPVIILEPTPIQERLVQLGIAVGCNEPRKNLHLELAALSLDGATLRSQQEILVPRPTNSQQSQQAAYDFGQKLVAWCNEIRKRT